MSSTTLLVDSPAGRTLNKFTPEQLLEVLSGLKPLSESQPDQARNLLSSNPDLTYALVQSMLLGGIIDESVVSEAVASTTAPVPAVESHESPAPSPAVRQDSSSPQSSAPELVDNSQPASAPAAAPPASGLTASQEAKLSKLDSAQAAMIRQVLAFTDEQVRMLPAEQRGTIIALRRQYS